MISVETAAKLLDLGSRIGGGPRADEQLRGAVALHNLLERHRVAYLADEVGMGKTYVALGALALFRHFNPRFRALVIAPKENLQRKWAKEIGNFVQHNVRCTDLRVRSFEGRPARAVCACDSLLDFVREVSLDPNRDFILRMSSFSLAAGSGEEGLKRLRDKLRHELPWLDGAALDARAKKEEFKRRYGRAVCCSIPTFDLVIVDEAHNLKHGYSTNGSARNELIAEVFGRAPVDDPHDPRFPGRGLRAKRVLFLSATPIDEGWRQLWNQLDLFGHGKRWKGLRDPTDDHEAQTIAQRILVRRVTSMRIDGQTHTRNLYRREWRRGGVTTWDDPITLRDDRERLMVGLVQKKVSEILGEQRFKRSFQIGMLASFESFAQTAKVRDEDASVFDDPEQTEDPVEREGADVHSLNALAVSYRKNFRCEMPHPKMDAVVARLAAAWETGEKSLVFVRRVASVRELKRKLDERYNGWLLHRLGRELPRAVQNELTEFATRFEDERARRIRQGTDDAPDEVVEAPVEDRGGADTFFAWFFRTALRNVLGGYTLGQRFQGSGAYATFFALNHVLTLLEATPDAALDRLGEALQLDPSEALRRLVDAVPRYLPRAAEPTVEHRFEAVQSAALELLTGLATQPELRRRAEARRALRPPPATTRTQVRPGRDEVAALLRRETFFSALSRPARADLRVRLWPEVIARDVSREAHLDAAREEALRAHLLGTAARLGHAFIDLYLLAVRNASTLRTGSGEPQDSLLPYDALITAYLDRLEQQRVDGVVFAGFHELSALSTHHDLVVDTNLPALGERGLAEITREVGNLLRQQQPVGGMSGQVNQTLVRQFRMPGYPLVLVTTDLLQEGEDLHTFCSSVYHYGISWTPSSMEQRVGRVDRVRSQTERRLGALQRPVAPDEKLQVYIPYLQDTVEVLQVERVLERMNRFLHRMHEGLTPPKEDDKQIHLDTDMIRGRRSVETITEVLKTAFPVRDEMLGATATPLAVSHDCARVLLARLRALMQITEVGDMTLTWEPVAMPGRLLGSARLPTGRQQPFTLFLRSDHGRPLLRCVSPVGRTDARSAYGSIAPHAAKEQATLGVIVEDDAKTYDLSVEDDVRLLDDAAHDTARLTLLLERVLPRADALERAAFDEQRDEPLGTFKTQLEGER